MNYQVDELPNREVKLTVEVDGERVQKALRQAARRAAQHVEVPGFRRGRAPYRVVERAVGKERLMQEAIEALLPEALDEVLEKENIQPFDLRFTDVDLVSEEPLTFQFIIPLTPEVTLGDLDNISVPAESVDVGDDEVNEVLEELRRSRSTVEAVDGPAEYEDEVTVDLAGYLMDGSVVDERQGVRHVLIDPVDLVDDEAWDEEKQHELAEEDEADAESEAEELISESAEAPEEAPAMPNPTAQLFEAMHGMMVNQVKETPVVYPDDWSEERLRGRTVLYRITMNRIERPVPPVLDEAFVKELTSDLDSVDALRERIHGNLVSQAEVEEFDRRIVAILDAVAEESELSYPDALVQSEVHRRINEMLRELRPYGIDLDRYLEVVGMTREQLEDQHWDDAEAGLRRSLVLGEFLRQQEIDLTDEELERALADEAPSSYVQGEGDVAPSEAERERVADQLRTRKALIKLYTLVTGEEAPDFVQLPAEREDGAPVEPALTDSEEASVVASVAEGGADEPGETASDQTDEVGGTREGEQDEGDESEPTFDA